MHTQIRKVAYMPTQKTWFSVIITDLSESQPIQRDFRIEALSPAAAAYIALRKYLCIYNPAEQKHLIEKELVTASVATKVDEHGRVIPYVDIKLPLPVRLVILAIAAMLGSLALWLLGYAWFVLTAG